MKKTDKLKLHEDDRFLRFMRRVWTGVSTRRKVINIIAVAAVVALLAVAIGSAVYETMTEARHTAIENARTLGDMEKAAEQYPDSVLLQMRLGTAYSERGTRENKKDDFEKSQRAFAEAVRHARTPIETGMASLALGKAWMNLERYVEALAGFDAASKIPETSPLIGDEANWYAGRCLELLKKPDDARERYSRVGGHGETIWESLAKYRQTELRRKSLD